MTDFNSSPYENTITSKSTLVPSDHQLDYNDGDTIRFDVPAFMSYIDPRQSVLKMNVKVRGSSIYRFNEKIGVQSVINNMRIYDGTQTHTLENLQNYAERLIKEYHYSENDSVKHKRDLLEGAESGWEDGLLPQDVGGSAKKDYSATMHQSQLGKGYSALQAVSSAPEVDGTTILANPNVIEVVLPLSSGILGTMSKRMFPAALTQGLKVEIDTNIATKSLQIWSEAGFAGQEWSATGGVADAVYVPKKTNFACAGKVGGGTLVAMTGIKIFADSLSPDVASTIVAAALAPADRARNVGQGMVGASNLLVGRPIFAWTTGAFATPTDPTYQCIGVINSMVYVPPAAPANISTIDITLGAVPAQYQTAAGGGNVANYTPATADDVIPTFAAVAAVPATFAQSGIVSISPADSTAECKYTLSNIELVLKTAAPPKAYSDNLFRQTQTEEGAVVDILTAETYRNNVNAGEVVAQINIPALNERAVSIMTLPIDQSLAHSVLVDNFATTLDNIQNYNFIINGQLQPTRKVLLGRLNNNKSEQVALWELEKALSSAKLMVRNLNEQESQFAIARALARYGGVYNLAADGNISLRIEYSSSTLPVKNKLLTSYIYGLRRIRATKNGLVVEL